MRKVTGTNPITATDLPDPDIIRVGEEYLMLTTTMHFFPGGQILSSRDLINWEHRAYIFDKLDSTPAQKLQDGYIYGKGMWAGSLRYEDGIFYAAFVCNDTQRTYLYTSPSLDGPWEKHYIEGFYHDLSLLFDGDRRFVVYGNTDIHLTELKRDLSGPLPGGIDRIIVSDKGNPNLGYEGSHIYKINGRYYLFLIHSRRDRWRRVEACFTADDLEGEFRGGDVYDEDLGIRDSGIAQGGIVEGSGGAWYSIMFQDSGAVGRMPVLVPVTFGEDGLPVFSHDALHVTVESFDADHIYTPLCADDDFRASALKPHWQFNHEPDPSLYRIDPSKGRLYIKTASLSRTLNEARNTLTMRTKYPECAAEVSVDASSLNDGDSAGLAILQGDWCSIAVCRVDGSYYAEMRSHESTGGIWDLSSEDGKCMEKIPLDGPEIRVRIECDFSGGTDEARCFIVGGGRKTAIGTVHKLHFRLDHFTGARFALFVRSSAVTGGEAAFSDYSFEG